MTRFSSGSSFPGADLHSGRSWVHTVVLLLIVCATLPYANTLQNSFVWDDHVQILHNPYLHSFFYLRKIFTTSVWSFTPGAVSNYYRPMMSFGYLLCYKLFSFTPWGFHLANLCWHGAVVWLLFFLTLRMYQDRTLAFAAASLFALHPIHTESVAWIAGVTDLQLTFFFLLTFWCFINTARLDGKLSGWTCLATMGSFVLALLSKEQALMLPLLATIYEHFYREDHAETTLTQKLARYGALWLLAAAYVFWRVRILGTFAPTNRFSGLTWGQTLISAVGMVGQYLWKLIWPVRLCAFYVFNQSTLFDLRVLLGGLGGLILCAILFGLLWKHARSSSFGLIWLLATLAPVLNPHWVGHNVFAERYLYLPSVGFCWVAAKGLEYLWVLSSRRLVWRTAAASGLSLVVVLCVLRIVIRNRDWQNDITLATKTLAVSPDAHDIRVALGEAYAEQKDYDAAEQEYRQVLDLDTDPHVYVRALVDLGSLLATKGQYSQATAFLLRAAEMEQKDGLSRANLGVVYWRIGLMEQAERNLRAAVDLAPEYIPVHVNLGRFYWQKGDRAQAEMVFRKALSIDPFDNSVHLALGELCIEEGRTSEATREYLAVLKTDATNLDAAFALARLKSRGALISKP